ncbi:MAG: hypothetical protein ACK56I_17445, partial [bacterium]
GRDARAREQQARGRPQQGATGRGIARARSGVRGGGHGGDSRSARRGGPSRYAHVRALPRARNRGAAAPRLPRGELP